MKKILTSMLLIAATLLSCHTAQAQGNTLFAYPVAPDTCTTLESRCNYSTMHFWDNFDYNKQLTQADDSLLLVAMGDFFSIMQHSNVNVGLSSIRNLLFKAQTNQPNFLKLVRVAEAMLYYSPVNIIDDVYLTFTQAVIDSKSVKNDVKSHYREQTAAINNSKLGEAIMNFDLTPATGSKVKLYDVPVDSAEIILLFFVNEETASDIAKTRLSVDLGVNELVEQGYAKVFCIYTGDRRPTEADAAAYPNWNMYWSKGIYKNIDVRMLPSFFVLDQDHKIMNKNVGVDVIKEAFSAQ